MRKITIAALVFLIITATVAVTFFCYHLIYLNKIFPGVYVGNISLGGKTKDQAIGSLQYLGVEDQELSLVETIKNDTYKFKASDLGFFYDTDSVINVALSIGRTGNYFLDAKTRISLIFNKKLVDLKFSYNPDLLNDQIEKIKEKFNKPSHNAYFYIQNNDIAIEKEQTGKRVSAEQLKSQVLKSFLTLDFSVIKIPMEDFSPQIIVNDLAPIKDQAKTIVFSNPVLRYNKNSFYLKPEDILKTLYPKSNGSVKLEIDQELLAKILDKTTAQINTETKGEVVLSDTGEVTEFRPSSPGRAADSQMLAAILAQNFLSNNIDRAAIEIPVKEIPVLDDPNSYGIKELLGEGKSKFSGSISSRIHNLTLASSIINGVLVAPGETFSFNKSVGDIDAQHGFSSAYIISKGRTVLGEGGGVCQVSTTLFRAVLNAGLAVVSRTAHAYRVGYYEQDSPPGFDATIYQPTVDFKFKNDTDKYVLISSEVDEKNLAMSFKIYGTNDGRKVEITVPEVTSQTPPPQPAYEETDTLAVGVKKQIDWSAWGAVVKFARTVSLDDKTLSEDKFVSNFRSWRAVYLVGTK